MFSFTITVDGICIQNVYDNKFHIEFEFGVEDFMLFCLFFSVKLFSQLFLFLEPINSIVYCLSRVVDLLLLVYCYICHLFTHTHKNVNVIHTESGISLSLSQFYYICMYLFTPYALAILSIHC